MITSQQLIDAGLNTETSTDSDLLAVARHYANDNLWNEGCTDAYKVSSTVKFFNGSIYYHPNTKES